MTSTTRPDRGADIEAGACSACGGQAERGPSGAWWHTDQDAAGQCQRNVSLLAATACFRPLPRVPDAEATLAGLTQLIAGRIGWDEPPELHFLFATADDTCHTERVGLPSALWAAAAPARILEVLARSVRRDPPPFPDGRVPAELYGAAAVAEAWHVEVEMPNFAKAREVDAAAMAGRLHQRPDRVECRNVIGVDLAGNRFMVTQIRDGKLTAESSAPGSTNPAMTGAVHDALAHMLAELELLRDKTGGD